VANVRSLGRGATQEIAKIGCCGNGSKSKERGIIEFKIDPMVTASPPPKMINPIVLNDTLAKVRTGDPNMRPSKRLATEHDKEATELARFVLGPQPSKELCNAYLALNGNPEMDDALNHQPPNPTNSTNPQNVQSISPPKSAKELRASLEESQKVLKRKLEEEAKMLENLGIAEEICSSTLRSVRDKGGDLETLISLLQAQLESERRDPASESLS